MLLGGIIMVIMGVTLAVLPERLEEYTDMTEEEIEDPIFVTIMGGVLMAIFVPLGLGQLMVGYAALIGKKWAWLALIILCLISVTVGVASIRFGVSTSLAGIIVSSFIIAYLFTRPAKEYFGRISPEPAVSPSTADSGASA